MNVKSCVKKVMKIFTPINKVIPKNEKKILLYSNLGFRDNVKSVYDYLIENGYNKRYKIVCSLNDYKNMKLEFDAENVKFVSNLSGFFHFFNSKFMFYSFGKFPIKPSNAQKVVNLWHGMPFKRVGNLEKGCENEDYFFFTHTIATSELFAEKMALCFNCPRECVLLYGQPRCDKLFKNDVKKEKLIVWLPTYRNSQKLNSFNSHNDNGFGFPIIENEEQLEELNNLLLKYGYTLIIKPHPLQDISNKINEKSNIRIITQKDLDKCGEDIYDLFKRSSGLVTDYSSVSFDYLNLDRPILYTLDDGKEYTKLRGFTVENPQDLMAGEVASDFVGVKNFVEEICNEIDKYKQKRDYVNKIANSHQSCNSTKEILDIIGLK